MVRERKEGVAHVEEEGRRRVAFYIFTPRSPFFARPPVNERTNERTINPLLSPYISHSNRPPRPFAVAVSWTGFLRPISPQGIYKNARGLLYPFCLSLQRHREKEREKERERERKREKERETERERDAWMQDRVARAAAPRDFNLENN